MGVNSGLLSGMFGNSHGAGAAALTGVGTTSTHVASSAARGLNYPNALTLDQKQSVCGSALEQAKTELLQGLFGENAETSQKIASIASYGLLYPSNLSDDEVRSICGSVLRQRSTLF